MKPKGLLIDIDGTLVHQGIAIPGAVKAIEYAQDSGLKCRFLTNITGRTPEAIATDLQTLGFPVDAQQIQTATTACVDFLKEMPGQTSHLLVPETVRPLFDGIAIDNERPDNVVISDIGRAFCFDNLNEVFLMLRNGARLIALQKNLFWYDVDGPKLDCGAFIAGLELATQQTAEVTGKPSRLFFEMALKAIACSAEEVWVIGDDPSTDLAGANAIGARSVQVLTGKSANGSMSVEHHGTHCLSSIADLPHLLDNLLIRYP
ncbi:TIGR01458 family HAD-type hydrolase [Pseudomonas farris]